ncbi:hypothetical protein RB195_020888 [Necator americanus]|uniref:Uncharacterized protein n=1 Tax=Necator americanus TaxID=51031 RepID=A0ABR1CL14_NECAM
MAGSKCDAMRCDAIATRVPLGCVKDGINARVEASSRKEMNVIVLLVCVWMFPTNEFVISSYNKGETTKISYPRSKRHGHRGRGCGHSGCMGPVHGSVHGSHKGTGCGERGCDGGGGHDFRSHHQYHASSSSGCGSDEMSSRDLQDVMDASYTILEGHLAYERLQNERL